jgi:aspartate aminotransferase-like enzyme
MMEGGDDLLEYSVIYTDRAKNLMAASFSQAFKDISNDLCEVYQADHCVLIPGSGSYGMEAVAGEFARYKNEDNYRPCMVIRNGFFSYRWSDIWDWIYPQELERSPELKVIKARPQSEDSLPSFAPEDVEVVISQIREHKPAVVFCAHVETSAGMMVTHEYIAAISAAAHEEDPDAIFVLDCIASGNVWTKMKDLGVDVLITAPQKGWTSPASVGIVMMNERAKALMASRSYPASENHAGYPNRGHSFCCNLAKWSLVADKYAAPGGFMYHTTLPTDALMTFRDTIRETTAHGLDLLQQRTQELGDRVRACLEKHGFHSVAADGNKAPTVVVSYMRPQDMEGGTGGLAGKFKAHGIQIATGVPLKIDEPWPAGGPPTFRIGLFGVDKLMDVDGTVKIFEDAVAKIAEV